jgi:hypothetical protein
MSSSEGVEMVGTAGHNATMPEGVNLAPGCRHFGDYAVAIERM